MNLASKLAARAEAGEPVRIGMVPVLATQLDQSALQAGDRHVIVRFGRLGACRVELLGISVNANQTTRKRVPLAIPP